MSLTSRIQALTAYANGVTGASDTTLANAVTTLANGYGGQLPSVISKIDGGSFTLTSDTALSSKWIEHSLDAIPIFFIIWADDLLSGTESIRYLSSCEFIQFDVTDSNDNNYIAFPTASMLYNGALSSVSNARVTTSILSQYATQTNFRFNNPVIYFKANVTYKWIACA